MAKIETSQILVNVRTLVDNAAIRTETRDGREKIIIPSATLPDNVVMNGILYPPEEIEASYALLEQTPAPFGHPMVNNRYVSASSPEGINGFWIGVHNENVTRKDGRVFMDKVVDVANAERTDGGKQLLDAINKGDPIHTSTGIFMQKELTPNADGYKAIARNMVFDHDAILLNEAGAATPDQGVGMMVNSAGDEMEVQNTCVEDWIEEEIDHLGSSIIQTIERKEKESRWAAIKDKVVKFIEEALQSEQEGAPVLNSNINEDESMAVTDEQFAELKGEVSGIAKTLATNSESLVDTLAGAIKTALEPIANKLESMEANEVATAKAETDKLTKTLIDSGIYNAEELEGMEVNVLKVLASKVAPGKSQGLSSNHSDSSTPKDGFKDFNPNADIDATEK